MLGVLLECDEVQTASRCAALLPPGGGSLGCGISAVPSRRVPSSLHLSQPPTLSLGYLRIFGNGRRQISLGSHLRRLLLGASNLFPRNVVRFHADIATART